MGWPEYTILVILLIQFINRTAKGIREEGSSNATPVLTGNMLYVALYIWVLYMGDFFL
jgi:hypothetical protein